MSTSTTPPDIVASHVARIQKATDDFNAAVEAASKDSVRIRYSKGPDQPGAWNGALFVREIAHVIVLNVTKKDTDQQT